MRNIFKEILNNPDVLYLDTETTGLASNAEVVEIAILDNKPKGEGVSINKMFKPTIPMEAGATSVSGITDEILKDKESFEKFIPEYIELIRNKTIVGWNINYDMDKINNTFKVYNYPEPKELVEFEIIDLMFKCMDFFDTRGIFLKQQEVMDCLEFTKKEEHRALSDVEDLIQIAEILSTANPEDYNILDFVPLAKKRKIQGRR